MAAHLQRPLWFAILAALLTSLLKLTAYWYTQSVGLLSDAAESGVNLIAAVTALASLWYSSQPVDCNHTYGHEKIEYFSSGIEGMLIAVAAVGIAWYAIRRLIYPEPIQELGVGLAISLIASAINFGVGMWLLRVGRRYHSIVLEADGQHLMTDVWTSVAVVAGLGLVALTGIQQLDPILALAMAGNILWTGFGLVRRSFNGLMDHALPAEELAEVRRAIESRLEPGTTFHALRTRQAGAHRFIDFHLLVPGNCRVDAAHRQAVKLEESIRSSFPSAEVVIHIEPIDEPASWHDSELLAIEENAPSKSP